ncbi:MULTISPECIES: neuraminidase-like domain-containing protein [Lysobacter]|uniref:Tc toxin subunit A-related protein n=1 Tax=Lysobacter TaxID=68 RepID=UPI001EECF253|nr:MULTISPECIES: neuraminidase-like domain-containing protein [Lysobacter]UJB21396.1 hypothetical protein L1A79_10240 [Lysobacter capsici]UJQ29488.1 hypothetical protein L2D09_04620 [Lysobacter gummosus]
MDPIILSSLAVLRLGDNGPRVANLHAVLERLDLAANIPQQEIEARQFGPNTMRAVAQFFMLANLGDNPSDGISDENALKLNNVLVSRRLLNLVEGTATDATGRTAIGYRIQIHDVNNLTGSPAIETSVDQNGHWLAFYDPRFYLNPRPGVVQPTDTMVLIARAFDSDGAEAARSDRTPNPKGRVRIDLVIQGDVRPPLQDGLRVYGTVVDRDGRGVDGLALQIYDRDIGRQRELLGEIKTRTNNEGKSGTFELRYTVDQYAAGDATAPDDAVADLVFVLRHRDKPVERFEITRLPAADNGPISTPLPVPEEDLELGIVARPDEFVQILVHGITAPSGLSEYERLMSRLAPVTKQVPLEKFDEAATRDISFAAREIDETIDRVADLVAAHKLTTTEFANTPAAALYGLARHLGARDARAIAARSAARIAAALETAVTALTIPEFDGDLVHLATNIHAAAVGAAMDITPAGASGTAGGLIADLINDRQARISFFTAAQNASSGAEFWSGIAETHPDLDADDLKYTLQLGTLTANNTSLVRRLKAEAPDAKSLRALALDIDRTRIAEIVAEVGGVPDQEEGSQARYTADIAGLLEAAHPTAVVARLAKTWASVDSEAVATSSAAILRSAVLRTDYDITHGDLDDLAKAQGDALFEGIVDARERDGALEGAKRLVRLFKVSADPATFGMLALKRQDNGLPFRGAIDIARYSKQAFLSRFPEADAEQTTLLAYTHDRASTVAATVSKLVIAQHQDLRDVSPAGAIGPLAPVPDEITPAGGPDDAEASGGTEIAAWSDLFGGSEVCECDDCRSVIGPAAYLVDLFEFLDKRCESNAGITPLDVLIGHPTKTPVGGGSPGITGRRPDLAHIKLTCENTNTTIPTIDLINEILESVVASGGDAPALPYESSPGITGPELSAAPEHVSEQAYKLVGEALYPITLPYDRLIATARVHLKQAGTSRAEIIRRFSSVDASVRDAAWAAETLGLFRRDYEVLTFLTLSGQALAEPIIVASLFGSSSASWMGEVEKVRRLLQALDISFVDLIALLRTRYIGGEVPSGDSANLMSRIFLDVDQLKAIRAADFTLVPDSLEARSLARGGLTLEQVRDWLKARTDRLATTIVLNPPMGCSPDEMFLRHLDGSHLIEEGEWLSLHRFVRLAKRMQVSFDELDVALSATAPDGARPQFTPEALARLAALAEVREMFDLSWPVAASLIGDIDASGTRSLYDTLFPPLGLARVHPDFRRNAEGRLFSVDRPIADGYAGIGAALAMTRDAIDQLARALKVEKLNLPGISAIHRSVVLGNALKLDPVNLVKLAEASGGPRLADTAALTAASLLDLVARVRRLQVIGMSDAMLDYLAGKPAKVGRTKTELDGILSTLRETIKPLHELDSKEKQEETGRELAGAAFSATELADRKARGDQRRRAAALTYAAVAFNLPVAIAGRLLEDVVANSVTIPALLRVDGAPAIVVLSAERGAWDDAKIRTLLGGIDRVATVVASAGLDPTTFALATGSAAALPAAALAALPGNADDVKAIASMLETLPAFVTLLTQTKRPTAMAAAISALALEGWTDSTFAAIGVWLDRNASAVAAVPREAIPELAEAAAHSAPVTALTILRDRMQVLRRLGMASADVAALAVESITSSALEKLIKGVSANYSRSVWLDVSRQLADPIRQQSRDALVAFLLQREQLNNAEELFDRFYIDVGTNPFVLTSRIRQAMFAVQIFVQRCLMGFERQNCVEPHQIEVEEWKTISRQPVWSARGKALLYPEELLDPSWRDNKSPAFKSFESTLQQGDITAANAEVAYRAYLDEFQAVAALEIVGTFLQDKKYLSGQEAKYLESVLHVVGRSRGSNARKYFYRRLNRYNHHDEWGNWEPVEVDIQSIDPDRQEAREFGTTSELREAGVHLLPVVWRDQLYLFWPTFQPKVDKPPETSINLGSTPRRSLPYWDVKLNWSTRQASGWAPRQQSSTLFETWWDTGDQVPREWDDDSDFDLQSFIGPPALLPRSPEPAQFCLKAIPGSSGLQVVLANRTGATGPTARARFIFPRAASDLTVIPAFEALSGDHFRLSGSLKATASYLGAKARGEIKAIVTAKDPDGETFFSTSEDMRFTTLNQLHKIQFEAPMFLDISDRSYLAQPSLGTSVVHQFVTEPEAKPHFGIEFTPSDLKLTAAAVTANPAPAANPWVAAAVTKFQPLLAASSQSIAEPMSEEPIAAIRARYYEYLGPVYRAVNVPALNLSITPFHHPFADTFAEVLRRDGLAALLTLELQKLAVPAEQTFAKRAKPNLARVVAPTTENLDFKPSTPYGNYNWELFFHAPVMLSHRLSQNSQHDAAIELLHQAVYNPFSSDPNDCWRFEGLRNIEPMRLDTMLSFLSLPNGDPRKENVEAQIDMMRLYPFQAHRTARLRPLAYRKWVVAMDVRLHLALGDRYFSRFTPEDVNQAIQYYMIAYREMGKRPEVVPHRVTMPAMSYAELRPNLDALGNVMFSAESKLAPTAGSATDGADTTSTGIMQLGAVGYFGIPRNEKLLALWDIVADRLFKIRNGMNIDGVQIQLPLFSPPIDPALLAEAVAAGLDISAVLEALAQPLPNQRYTTMQRRAVELAEAVVRLGDLLLSAREKRDSEGIARTRAANEKAIINLVVEMRKRQIEEAEAQREIALHEEDAGNKRWRHFAELLDRLPKDLLFSTPFLADPSRQLTLVEADKIKFEKLSVIPDFAKAGSLFAGVAAGLVATVVDEGAEAVRPTSAGTVLQEELMELESEFDAVKTTFEASALDTLASILGTIPNIEAASKPIGAGVAVHFGGQFLAAAAASKARNKRAVGDMQKFAASVYKKQGELVLRERGWVLEMNEAALTVQQARRRLVVSDIQVDLAKKALKQEETTASHAEQMEIDLKQKFSSTELYDWTEQQLRRLFKQAFSLALETAQMAEACYRFEREDPPTPFLRMSPPANTREELVAGHDLLARLRAMDRAYNAAPRLPELTRTVSLRQIAPFALDDLRNSGTARFRIPELLFDIDHPGYYDRRIRSVEVTIPCVTGPYSPVTGTLTLTGSRRRKVQKVADAHDSEAATGASIALSSGRSDSGLFELSTQDPQYFPFEGMGIDSDWTLTLPSEVKTFDYWSIADVAITLRYTARRGTDKFRDDVNDALKELVKHDDHIGAFQLVSVRHELCDAWARFKAGEALKVELSINFLPFMLQNLGPTLKAVNGRLRMKAGAVAELSFTPPVASTSGWSVTVQNPPDEYEDRVNVEDITLFALFEFN